MPQFPRQSLQPLSPRSLRGALRRIRELADSIEARADATAPHERAMLTRAINGLASAARELSRRHRQVSVAAELSEPLYGHAMLANDHHPGPRCACRECLREYPGMTT